MKHVLLLILGIALALLPLFLFLVWAIKGHKRMLRKIKESGSTISMENNKYIFKWYHLFTYGFLLVLISGLIIIGYENLESVIGVGYMVFKIIEWPIYIFGLLYVIYLLVRFVKWAWNND